MTLILQDFMLGKVNKVMFDFFTNCTYSIIFVSIHIDACKRTTDDKNYFLANKIKSYCYTIFLYNYNNTKLLYVSRSYYEKFNNNIYLKQHNNITGDII